MIQRSDYSTLRNSMLKELEEDMPKLFNLFGKLKRTAEINSEGIGMGLMICQNLVKMNKGTIEVHSDGDN